MIFTSFFPHAFTPPTTVSETRQPMFPIQMQRIEIDRDIQADAYEVYAVAYDHQKSLLDPATCRGGFGTNELVAFLWARQFPREQWRAKVEEAFGKIKPVR